MFLPFCYFSLIKIGLSIFIMLYLKMQSSRMKKDPEIYLKKMKGKKRPKSVLIFDVVTM